MTTTNTQELEQVLAHTVRQLGEVAAGSVQMKLPRPFQRPTPELMTALAALADRGEIFRHPTARTKFLAFDARAEVRTLVAGALGPKALTEAEVKKLVAKKGASLGLGRASGPLTAQALKALVRDGTAYEHRRPPPPSAPTRPPPKTVRYASVPQPPIDLAPYVRRNARELRALVKRLASFGATTAEALRTFAAELGFGAPSPEGPRDKATPVRENVRPPAPVVETRPPVVEVRSPITGPRPPANETQTPPIKTHPPSSANGGGHADRGANTGVSKANGGARGANGGADQANRGVGEKNGGVGEKNGGVGEANTGAGKADGGVGVTVALSGPDDGIAPNGELQPNGDAGGGPTPDESKRRLLRALDEVAAREPDGSLLLVERVRDRAGLGKAVFDCAAIELARAEQVVLHYHDYPTSLPPDELERLVVDEEGTYYIGIARRRAE